MEYLDSLRKEYHLNHIHKDGLNPSPFKQFGRWLEDALKAQITESNAMTLATVDAHSRPRSRVVLLKYFDENGFKFFTNYTSDKAKELDAHPFASLCFWWEKTSRQVRIDGRVERLTEMMSDDYFQQRNRESNISAYASLQSRVIAGRETLMQRCDEMAKRFEGQEQLPRPDFWGGYVVKPDQFEFWQGGEHRLHDRFRYRQEENGEWIIERLAP